MANTPERIGPDRQVFPDLWITQAFAYAPNPPCKTGLRRRIKKSQSQAHDRPWGQLQGHEADRLPIPEVPNAQGPAQVPV